MATARQLKIQLLKDENDFANRSRQVLQELHKVDPQAAALPLAKAIASRALIKQLWDLLPDEQQSLPYPGVEEQTEEGKQYIPVSDLNQVVTLHLGWDLLCFSCTLEAAWQSWMHFCRLDTDTFNCCIYPPGLEWYLVRAGNNLYPMHATGQDFHLLST